MPSEYEPDVISLHRESYSCHVSRKQDLTEIHNSLFRLPLFDPSQIRIDLHAIIMQMKKIPKSPSPPASSVILEPGPWTNRKGKQLITVQSVHVVYFGVRYNGYWIYFKLTPLKRLANPRSLEPRLPPSPRSSPPLPPLLPKYVGDESKTRFVGAFSPLSRSIAIRVCHPGICRS